ncbi:MAG: hypothetical protein O3C40_07345 [Planctomycetota bacterium]|nr:hypothetical protein [Planctomycetota bacterium]
MQPHLADNSRKRAAATTTADHRSSERHWNTDFVVTRYVVVLNLGPVCRAELINESDNGIAIQVRELESTAAVGRSIDVIYHGQRHTAEIRHITENENGFLVGLQWKKVYAQ